MSRKRILLLVLLGLLLVGLVGAGVFVWWANDVAEPTPRALAAMQSDEQVAFMQQGDWMIFTPRGQLPKSGFVFYPGGRVDYRAYAPLAREIAANGYLVVVPSVRLNLSILEPNAAEPVMDTFHEIEEWAVGGHSLGGAAASIFADANQDRVDGLVFYASYPASDMSGFAGRVSSISGSRDGLATPDKMAENKPKQPSDTIFRVIEGGNHAQFGDYGAQAGDNPATISIEEQQAQAAHGTVELLEAMLGTR